MLTRRTGGVLALAGVILLGTTTLGWAVQEPGTEYIYVLDDANSNVVLQLGSIIGDANLAGYMTIYMDDPNSGTCVLGTMGAISSSDLAFIFYPGVIEAYIDAGNFQAYDFDLWYQDPNDWNLDPNMWPDPNDAEDASDAPDPNDEGDPNDPNYNDPNDPNYARTCTLVNGQGILNSEILFFWSFRATTNGVDWDIDADIDWSDPFAPWQIKIGNNGADAHLEWGMEIGNPGDLLFIKGTVTLEGVGGVARTLTVTTDKVDWGTVEVDPDWPRIWPKFADGQEIVLTATPIDGKILKEWRIWDDPNDYPDTGLATIDSNAVLTLTMNGDKHVEAKFKCGSNLPPFIAMTLLALAVAVMIRRLK